ncbi:MAG: efflux RND transporter periplasmic adaptor subunit [Vulcanimicrobiota bacterium]
MNRIRNYLIIAIIVAFALGLAGCGPGEQQAEEFRVPVMLSEVTTGDIEESFIFVGTIKPERFVDVYSKLAAKARTVYVEEGDFVNKGDLLAKLDDDDLQAQLRQALAGVSVAQAKLNKASSGYELTETSTDIQIQVAQKGVVQARENVAQAESSFSNTQLTYNRMKTLQQKGAVAQQALDQATTQFEVARSRLEAARAQLEQAKKNLELAKANTLQKAMSINDRQLAAASLSQAEANVDYLQTMISYTQVLAPISGYITARDVEPGQLVSPGDKLSIFRITDNSNVYLEADVPESKITGVTRGKEVEINIDALPESKFTGNVDTVIPSVDPLSRTFKIKVKVQNKDNLIKSGMTGVGTLVLNTYQGVVVPREWLKVIEGDFYVVKIREENGEKIGYHEKVDVGFHNERRALIREGAQAGEMVVTSGQATISDGDKVLIKEKQN